ncbi:MAG: alpha-2-macroglobulin family protein, partial [Acidobacteriota bacterium]
MVTDSARREIEGKASFVGTRGNISVSANSDRYVYYKGETAKVRVRTRDYEGRPVATKVGLKFSLSRWEKIEKEDNGYKYTDWVRKFENPTTGEVTTNAQGEAVYEYRAAVIGDIDIKAVVTENGKQIEHDAGGLYVTSENDQWVSNAWRDEGSIKLVADKKSYKVGETAKILALLPTDKAHLLVTTEMARVLETRHVFANGRAVMIDLPIKETYSPNIQLSVAYVKNGEMFEHSKNIAVPAANKFLNIELIPDKQQYKPRDPASYQIIAKNSDGTPAAGVEVSLGLVDEAIYSIRPDSTGDIRRAFYGTRYTRVSTNFAAAFQFTGYSGDKKIDLAQNKRSYQLADFKDDSQYADPKIRKDFRDTAFWQPDVITAADGKATVRLNLPDNLTTWRATARAVTADLKVGSKIGKVISRKDLILRLETPRFATEGDTVTISGIVHNYQKEDKVTQVELKVTGAQLLDAGQQTVTIPKDGEHRIDWRISTANFGNVTLLATAKTSGESDGVELPMPVVAAGTRITKGESLAISEDSAEKQMSFVLPGNAHAQARTLRIEAAPSVAGAMFGALDYLTTYPYGCTEQTMSSFLPNVIVAQTVKEVKTASIGAGNNLGKKVQQGLDRLYGFQHEDGGWGWWKDDKTDPFMTAYVMDGLALAERAGYGVEPYRVQQGRKKIQQLLDTGKMEDGNPFDIESRAYLLYAQQISGGADAKYAGDMFNRRSEMQPYARALLALTLKLRNDNRAQLVASDIERTVKMSNADAYWPSKR